MKSYSYRDVFSQRAQSHYEAFIMYPDACRTEVENCLSFVKPKPGEVLLDMPSAGGYLSSYIHTPNLHVIAIDPTPEFIPLCKNVVSDTRLSALDDLPLKDKSVDIVVCLAGLHHEPSPDGVLAEISRVLKDKTGRVIIAEINSGSNVAHFFNKFVHQYNSNGHYARFIDDNFMKIFSSNHLRIEHDEILSYHWPFESRFALGDCLQRMFGINLSTPEKIADAVEEILGIDNLPDGRIGMRWSLRFIYAKRDTYEK